MPAPDNARVFFNISVNRLCIAVLVFCVSVEMALFALDWWINHEKGSSIRAIRRMFNTTREDSIASCFGVTQTFVVALLAALNMALVAKTGGPIWRRAGWLIIALLFIYMAVDDGAKIHERLGTAAKDIGITKDAIAAYPSYAWHLVVGPFFVLWGVLLLAFLWREIPKRFLRSLILAAFGLFAVALILDYLEGLDDGYVWITQAYDITVVTANHFSRSIEECIEMLAMSLFLTVFLKHLASHTSRVEIEFD